jgi:hypothetical protein
MPMKRHVLVAVVAFGTLVPALAQDIPAAPAQPLRATGAYPIRQDKSQWLGSNLIGAKVVSASDETIGHVANLIVNDDGAVEAAVISVGGVLGIGKKDVAVTYKSLNIARTKSGDAIDHVTLAATKTDLQQAAAFQPLSRQKPDGQKR